MPDVRRIAERLEALWRIRRGPGGGADRAAFSAAEAKAMRLVADWAAELGLEPGIDAHGNLWALPPGWSGPVVTAGSHVDTVPDGGRYDGALGTVLGLEMVADLADPDPRAGGAEGEEARPGALICAAEEAPRFGAGTIGSRLLVGTLAPADLEELRDGTGVSAAEALHEYLERLSALPRVEPPLARMRAHAEVHVAQRRALRRLGVVSTVAAPRRYSVTIRGQSGHAGEMAMEERRDALAAAAEVVLAVEAAARAEPAETVATVGTIAVSPGAVSVIPGEARLGIDVRGISSASVAAFDGAVRAAIAEIARHRGVRAEVTLRRAGEPVAMDAELVVAALAAARRLGVPATQTWSGAGHDAQHLAAIAPTLLLFVPLQGGESHTPQEGAEMSEIVQAAEVTASVLRGAIHLARP